MELWLSVDALADVSQPLDIGANFYREDGRVIVFCVAPHGTGTTAVRALAKSVANVFRGLGPRNPSYGEASIGLGDEAEGGPFYILPVTITYFYEDRTS